MATWLEVAVAAVGGGTVTGLISPLLSWTLNNQKERKEARSKLLERVETSLSSQGFNLRVFVSSVDYMTIKQYFEMNIAEEIDSAAYKDEFIRFSPEGGDDRILPASVRVGPAIPVYLGPPGRFNFDTRFGWSKQQHAIEEIKHEVARLRKEWKLV